MSKLAQARNEKSTRPSRRSTKRSAKTLAGSEPVPGAPRPMTGFLALLTPEQREAALSYTGDDTLGDPASFGRGASKS